MIQQPASILSKVMDLFIFKSKDKQGFSNEWSGVRWIFHPYIKTQHIISLYSQMLWKNIDLCTKALIADVISFIELFMKGFNVVSMYFGAADSFWTPNNPHNFDFTSIP